MSANKLKDDTQRLQARDSSRMNFDKTLTLKELLVQHVNTDYTPFDQELRQAMKPQTLNDFVAFELRRFGVKSSYLNSFMEEVMGIPPFMLQTEGQREAIFGLWTGVLPGEGFVAHLHSEHLFPGVSKSMMGRAVEWSNRCRSERHFLENLLTATHFLDPVPSTQPYPHWEIRSGLRVLHYKSKFLHSSTAEVILGEVLSQLKKA